jgi:hypothetical protein
MVREIYQADAGISIALTLLISVGLSAIPALFTAILQWIRRHDATTIIIQSDSKQIDIKNLNPQDVTSIIDALKDKADGRQAKL